MPIRPSLLSFNRKITATTIKKREKREEREQTGEAPCRAPVMQPDTQQEPRERRIGALSLA